MNRRNDWESTLKETNADLSSFGYSLKVYEEEPGFFFLDIVKDGKAENYAGNYYEDELEDLILDAWHYVKSEKC